jgi:hypothetical protein
MSAPAHSRPFDLSAARAGAPFACVNGLTVKIHNWQARGGDHLIFGEIAAQNCDVMAKWDSRGTCVSAQMPLDLVMLPLGIIDGKPVFVGDDLIDPSGAVFVPGPTSSGHLAGCTWPAPPNVYPETLMGDDDLRHAAGMNHNNMTMTVRHLHSAANAALRHAVDTSQVVDAEQSTEAIRKAYADGQAIAYKHEGAGRAERDMAIVRATVLACKARFNTGPLDMYSGENVITRLSGIHPKSVIATVK